MEAPYIRLIFYAGTEWLGFRTLFSSCNLLYQVIKELHIASLSKVFGYAKTKKFSFTRLWKENFFGKFVKIYIAFHLDNAYNLICRWYQFQTFKYGRREEATFNKLQFM
ncbi:hypothetical protein FO495_20310 [Bacillus tropicus]|nr:hypothetical protein [Bacillus tropicus]